MFRFFALLVVVLGLSACEDINDLSKPPAPIGEFSLAHNVVVAPNLVMGPASREASNEAWTEAVKKAVDERFSRYDGDQHYHFGISLEGYVLAQPGLPVVLSPKSVLILKLTVWDDAAGKKLNEEPEQITVLENLDGETIVGSGLTKTADEQMKTLAENSAKLIQRWITREHRTKQWFKRTQETARLQADAAEKATEEAKVSLETAVEPASKVKKKAQSAAEIKDTSASATASTAATN